MATTSSPILQLQRGETFSQQVGAVMSLQRALLYTPIPSPILQLNKGSPIGTLGIRGPQIEPLTLESDRFENDFGFLLGTTSDIDLTTTGQTTIYTVPSNVSKVLILGVVLEVAFGSEVTVAPQASVGIDPVTDNVFAAETLTEFAAGQDLYTFWSNLNITNVANANDSIVIDVSSAATATNLTVTARVFGVQVGASSVERNIAAMAAGISSSAPTIDATESSISFDSVLYGDAELLDSGSIVIPSKYSGRYGWINWNVASTGLAAPNNSLFGYMAVNGDFTINNGIAHGRGGGGAVAGSAGPILLVAGDTYTLRLRWDSGSETIQINGDSRPANISIMVGGA